MAGDPNPMKSKEPLGRVTIPVAMGWPKPGSGRKKNTPPWKRKQPSTDQR